jgi:ribose 5-phosphate isomerase B
MKVAMDSDDIGAQLKKQLIQTVRETGVEVTDLNFLAEQKGDYPDVAFNLATRIQRGEFDRGILICGTGEGMAMCANKVRGVFAGVAHDVYSAERLRKSNDAQVLTLGALVIGIELAKVIVDAWLKSEFAGGRSAPKVARMRELENEAYANLQS